MRLKRLLISAVAVLGLSALGSSANAAAPTATGAGHDQIAGKGNSTFTLIFRGGGFRGGGFHRGGFRGGGFAARPAFRGGRSFAFAGRLRPLSRRLGRPARLLGRRLALGVGRAGVALTGCGGWGRPGWGVRRAYWGGGWGRPGWGVDAPTGAAAGVVLDGAGAALAGGAVAGAGPLA